MVVWAALEMVAKRKTLYTWVGMERFQVVLHVNWCMCFVYYFSDNITICHYTVILRPSYRPRQATLPRHHCTHHLHHHRVTTATIVAVVMIVTRGHRHHHTRRRHRHLRRLIAAPAIVTAIAIVIRTITNGLDATDLCRRVVTIGLRSVIASERATGT